MQTAYHTTTTVLPGHRIEFTAPEIAEGARVRVVVVPEAGPIGVQERRSALEIIEAYNGPGLFRTAEEVDRHINEERDSWDQ